MAQKKMDLSEVKKAYPLLSVERLKQIKIGQDNHLSTKKLDLLSNQDLSISALIQTRLAYESRLSSDGELLLISNKHRNGQVMDQVRFGLIGGLSTEKAKLIVREDKHWMHAAQVRFGLEAGLSDNEVKQLSNSKQSLIDVIHLREKMEVEQAADLSGKEENYFAMYDGVLSHIGSFSDREQAQDHINPTNPDWLFVLDQGEAEEWIEELTPLLLAPSAEGSKKYAVLKGNSFHMIGEFPDSLEDRSLADKFAEEHAFNDDWAFLADEGDMTKWLSVLKEALPDHDVKADMARTDADADQEPN